MIFCNGRKFPWYYSGRWELDLLCFQKFHSRRNTKQLQEYFSEDNGTKTFPCSLAVHSRPCCSGFLQRGECSIWKEEFVSSVANLMSTTAQFLVHILDEFLLCGFFFFFMCWFIVQRTWIMQWSHWKISTKHARDSSSPLTMSFFIISFNFHMPPSTPWTSWQLRSTESSWRIPEGVLTLSIKAGANLRKQESSLPCQPFFPGFALTAIVLQKGEGNYVDHKQHLLYIGLKTTWLQEFGIW